PTLQRTVFRRERGFVVSVGGPRSGDLAPRSAAFGRKSNQRPPEGRTPTKTAALREESPVAGQVFRPSGSHHRVVAFPTAQILYYKHVTSLDGFTNAGLVSPPGRALLS